MSTDDVYTDVGLLTRLERLAHKIERLEPQLEEARRELHQGIIEGRERDIPITTLARVTGLSRSRIYQLTGKE